MTIRRKLLILLLLFSLTPLVIGSSAGRAVMQNLGDRVTQQTSAALLEDQRRDLRLVAESYASPIQSTADEVDRSLRVVGSFAAAALQDEFAATARVYAARTDFGADGAAPALVPARDGASASDAFETYAAMSTLFSTLAGDDAAARDDAARVPRR